MDWKLASRKIAPAIAAHAIVASNTSGLLDHEGCRVLPEGIAVFCGIHFFNPPRYMALRAGSITDDEPRPDQFSEALVTDRARQSVVRG
jgi:3-hydroxyacyl-CoA dehydrogenase